MKVFSSHIAFLLSIGVTVIAYQCSALDNHEGVRRFAQDHVGEVDLHLKHRELVSAKFDSLFNRFLKIGDFERFNELFKDAELMLVEEITLEEEGLASLNVRNLVCTDFNLGDLQTEYEVLEENGNEVLAFTINAYPFAMKCSADYSYSLLSFLGGFGLPSISDDGRFSVVTSGNLVETRIDLVSPSFELEPPSTADVEFCNAVINIDGGIDFEDGALDDILELFGEPIADLIQGEASKAACSELESLGPEMFGDLLNTTKTFLNEWLQPIPEEKANPLVKERDFAVPETVRLINFQNSTGDGTIVDKLVDLLKNADSFLGSNGQGEASGELGINELLRNGLLDENGAMKLTADDLGSDFDSTILDVHDKLTESVVKVEGIQIFGVDSLTTFNPFQDIGKHTLSNDLRWEKLSLELAVSLRIKPSTLPDSMIVNPEPVVIEEDIKIKVEFTDLNVVLAVFMAIDQDKFEGITLGSILDENLLPCLASTMSALEVTGLDVSVGDISDPTLDGFVSPGFDRVLSNLAEAGFRAYEPTLLRAIPYIFQVTVRNMLNNLVADLFEYGDDVKCPEHGESTELSFIDFRDLMLPPADAVVLGGSGDAPYGTLLGRALDLIKREFFAVDPATGFAAINTKVIASFTESQSGTPGRLFFPGSLFNIEGDVIAGGMEGSIALKASDLYVNNLDTIGVPLSLLDPLNGEPYQLNNSASIGSTSHPLQLGLRFFFGLVGEGTDIQNDLTINLDIDTLRFLLTFFAKVSENAFLGFPIRDITNLNCWLATIPPPQLDSRGVRKDPEDIALMVTDFLTAVARLGLNVTCIDCSGPKMTEFASLDGSEALTELTNSVFDLAVEFVEGDFLQNAADRALQDARKKCPHSPDYDPDFIGFDFEPFVMTSESQENSVSFLVAFLIVLAALIFTVLTIVLTTKLIVRRRNRRWIESISQRQIIMIWELQHKEKEEESELDVSTQSMFRSNSIPAWLRFTMPLIILGNIGFFLSGHLSLGGSVTIAASIAGQTFTTTDFYQFSMGRSTIEMWKAGARELAMLVFILSFAWPYTKQLLTLGLWFAPPTKVSAKRRGSILLWLDALAKWSMADIFIMVIFIVCFRVSIQSPDVAFLPEDFYSIDLLVIPKWGLYANMTAQLISQISSHFIIHYHRRIIQDARGGDEDEHMELEKQNTAVTEVASDTGMSQSDSQSEPDTTREEAPIVAAVGHTRLSIHAFTRPHRGETDKLVTRRVVSPGLLLLSMCICVLIIVGCVVPSYSLNVLGIVGVLVESGQGFIAAHTEYSVFSTIKLLFDQAIFTGRVGDYIGLGVLSVLLILSVLIVPVLQCLVLLVQWFAPLTQKRRYRLSIALEVLQAWQYVEVYLISVLVGSWQLGSISQFLFNPFCTSLDGLLSDMVYYGILKEEDAQCFEADVNVEPTFYILLAAAIVLAFVNAFITKAASQYFHEINESEMMTLYRHKLEDVEDIGAKEMATTVDRSAIHPAPILFTDEFRWFLRREDAVSSRSSLGCEGGSTSVSDGDGEPPLSDGNRSNEDITSLDDSTLRGDQARVVNESSEDVVSVDIVEDSYADQPAAFDDVLSEWNSTGSGRSEEERKRQTFFI